MPQPCRAVVFLFPSRRKVRRTTGCCADTCQHNVTVCAQTATGEEAVAHTSVEGGSSDASPSCGASRGGFHDRSAVRSRCCSVKDQIGLR